MGIVLETNPIDILAWANRCARYFVAAMTANHSAFSFTTRKSKKVRVGSGWLEWCSLAGGVDVFSVESWVKYPLGTSAFQIELDSSTISQRATHISKRPVAIELCQSLDNPSASEPTNRKKKKKQSGKEFNCILHWIGERANSLYQPNRSQTSIVGSQLLQHRPSR